ncbi:MAG: hypothetical protein ACLP05_11360 [Candidatus Kryptoniota bacterium]
MKDTMRIDSRKHIRKAFRTFLALAVLPIFLAGCKSSTAPGGGGTGILIKGSISTGGLAKRAAVGDSLTLADAKKVLVFYAGTYKIFDIQDTSFSAYAQIGSATAVAFLDANNKYIGNLCAGGMNVLPLVSLTNGENTVIDLSTLTLDGTNVIPANNPFGSSINMTADEIKRFKELSGYFESLSKNIDADNDGVPDILDQKGIDISSVYTIQAGTFGIDNTPPQQIDTSNFFINYYLHVNGGKNATPASQVITFSGPAGHPYTDIRQSGYSPAPDGFTTGFERKEPREPGNLSDSIWLPFEEGIYTMTLDGTQTYTFEYSNVDTKYYMLVPVPTLHTDGNGKVTSVTVEYRLPDNSGVDPTNFVYQVSLIFDGKDDGTILKQIGTIYQSPEAKTWTELYNFTVDPPLEISAIGGLCVCYVDLIGNQYQIGWH